MDISTDQLGYISMRNEDGTQWYTVVYAMNCWGDSRAERRPFTHATFLELQGQVEESKKNDCPDNGFFGIYNLTFHPCTQEEAHEQQIAADAAQREREAEEEDECEDDEREPSYEDDAFDYEESRASAQMERLDMWRNEY